MKKEVKEMALIAAGGFVFACSMNLFIIPLGLYSGGFIGVAQLLSAAVERMLPAAALGLASYSGCFNLLLNLPMFFIAYKLMPRSFLIKTLLCIVVETLTFSYFYVPAEPVLPDYLSNCIAGAVLGGVGIGIVLRNYGSGGGLDLLSVLLAQKCPGLSVGIVEIIFNTGVYAVCAVTSGIPIAVFSVIYSGCLSFVMDKMHDQNIKISCIIITEKDDALDEIQNQLHRGATCWKGTGAFEHREKQMILTILNKREAQELKKYISLHDPNAFVVFQQGVDVQGLFDKRLFY